MRLRNSNDTGGGYTTARDSLLKARLRITTLRKVGIWKLNRLIISTAIKVMQVML